MRAVWRLDRLWGGAAGRGLFANVPVVWLWLSRHYRPGDRLFLFGFSCGSYTARNLAGMLAVCGIGPGDGPAQSLADEAYRRCRERDPDKRGQLGRASPTRAIAAHCANDLNPELVKRV